MANGIKIGNLNIGALKVGSYDCEAAYLGDVKVYPSVKVVAKYNVTSTSSPTRIAYNTSNFSSIEIDGVAQPSVITGYTFDTVGEHVVKYTLTDPTRIGASAFSYCTSLTSIDIPNSVTSIGSEAFRDCTSLTSCTIGGGVTSLGNSAFSNCNRLTSIDIPSGVTSIGNNAFNGCTSLTNVTIPDSVTSIGDYAFAGCSNLANMTSNAMEAPAIQSNTFQRIKTDGTLTVPSGSSGYDVWMQNANYYLGLYNWTKVEQ